MNNLGKKYWFKVILLCSIFLELKIIKLKFQVKLKFTKLKLQVLWQFDQT